MKARQLQVGHIITQYLGAVGKMTVTEITKRDFHINFKTDNDKCPTYWFPHWKNISVENDTSGKGFGK